MFIKIKAIVKHFHQDSLYRNSFYLILSTAIQAILGFIFWAINARLYTTEQIGVVTTLISISSLIMNFSLLGLNQSFIRFLPGSNQKSTLVNSGMITSLLTASLASIIYISNIDFLTPKLGFIKTNNYFLLAFLSLVIFNTLNILNDSIFISHRDSRYVLIKNVSTSTLKILFGVLFIFLGTFGLFLSVSLSMTATFILGSILLFINYKYKILLEFDKKIIKSLAKFSFSNYLAGLVGGLPLMVLPIFITNNIGSSAAAYFYIDIMIINILSIIPAAVTQSLFAEGSHSNTGIKTEIFKAIKMIGFFLIPAVLVVSFFGKYILLFFGKSFSDEGFIFLQIMSLSQIVGAVNYIFWTILKIKNKNKEIVFINIINTFVTLGVGYLLVSRGLFGVAIGWLAGELVIALIYLKIVIDESKIL